LSDDGQNVFEYGAGDGDICRKQILLGETKYYCVSENSDGELTMGWTSDLVGPLFNKKNVSWTVERTNTNDTHLGVYYEYKNEKGVDITERGFIRLVGRYLPDDQTKTYKVHLKGTVGQKSVTMQIEVKKPACLYDPSAMKTASNNKPYRWTTNVWGTSVDIDAICIQYAGVIGIPPQVIKAQMFQESDKTGDKFNPSYRYEPWQDDFFADPNRNPDGWEDYSTQPFWVTGEPPNPMGEGKIVPLNHQNVHPVYYPSSPVHIADYVLNNWGQYFKKSDYTVIGSNSLTVRLVNYANTYNFIYLLNGELGDPVSQAISLIKHDIKVQYTQIAQTRKAASYGLIQMLYTTAQPLGYNRGNDATSSHAPEELNDETIEMPFYEQFTEANLSKEFSKERLDFAMAGDWPLGWEKTWMNSFGWYNKDAGYAPSVFANSRRFYPQASEVKP
jgi:hypothetical protein